MNQTGSILRLPLPATKFISSWKRRRFQILAFNTISSKPATTKLAKCFHAFIVFMIILNVTMIILDTVDDFTSVYAVHSHYFELFSVIVFTSEYLLRVYTCVVNKKYRSTYGRLRYMRSAFALVDLMAIAPFFIPMLVDMDLIFLRTVRLLRLFRLFKLGRYSRSYSLIAKVMKQTWRDISVSMVFIFTIWIIGSSVIYMAERQAQPSLFSSIPATMWWTIITLTTTGYGDMYPITIIGKIAGGCLAIIGVCIFAIPAAIITSAFVHETNPKIELRCSNCGHKIQTQKE